MSHRPFTFQSVKDTASAAYDTAAETVNAAAGNKDHGPNQDKNDLTKGSCSNITKKVDPKDKFNEAAHH